MIKRLHLFCMCVLLLCGQAAAQSDHNFEVAKYLDIFNAIYRQLDVNYVDSLDPKKTLGTSITVTLMQLDPYTEYYTEESKEDLRTMTTGKYAGIGASIRFSEKEQRCSISLPFQNMPADRAGLRPGDVILSIDGQDLLYKGEGSKADFSEMVSSKLRGEPGTTFELRVMRGDQRKTLLVKLTRENVVRPSVPYSRLLPDSTGFVVINQFIEGTSADVRHAVIQLKKQGMKRLIIDLRDNPGGLVEEAVNTVSLFVPRGREVVHIKGKSWASQRSFVTKLEPLDKDMPLVVLVNSSSASAAEIMSGALQDYDRAVVIGERTYGKGLVQQSAELPYGAVLKYTVGKYYIPSGRCVQAYKFEDGEPIHLADSLTKAFSTAAGRTVRDGGGITPDLIVREDSISQFATSVNETEQFLDFCSHYRNTHSSIGPAADFRLTDADYEAFCQYMKQSDFRYERNSLKLLEALRAMVHREGLENVVGRELDSLEHAIKQDNDYEFKRWESELRYLLESIIVFYYYYEPGVYDYLLPRTHVIQRAIEVVRDSHLMHKLLSGEPEA